MSLTIVWMPIFGRIGYVTNVRVGMLRRLLVRSNIFTFNVSLVGIGWRGWRTTLGDRWRCTIKAIGKKASLKWYNNKMKQAARAGFFRCAANEEHWLATEKAFSTFTWNVWVNILYAPNPHHLHINVKETAIMSTFPYIIRRSIMRHHRAKSATLCSIELKMMIIIKCANKNI